VRSLSWRWFDGAWRSPVARLVWDQKVPGSNPGAPISKSKQCLPLAPHSPHSCLARFSARLRDQPYWAARGHLLARAGRAAEASEAFTVAIGLTTDEAVRAYLQRQLAGLQRD
jgi:hypothetical protein